MIEGKIEELIKLAQDPQGPAGIHKAPGKGEVVYAEWLDELLAASILARHELAELRRRAGHEEGSA